MIDSSSLLIFVTAAAILLITPGPAVLFIVARSIEQGRLAGLVSVLGIGLGGLVHIFAAALGLSAILLTSALAFNVVKIAGALYLVFLGIQTLLSKDEVGGEIKIEKRSYRNLFWQGAIVQVLNPKAALFIFAFLPQFINTSSGSTTSQILFLGGIFMVMAVVSDGLYALLAGTAREWLSRNRVFVGARKYVTGSVYIGLGVLTAFAGSDGG